MNWLSLGRVVVDDYNLNWSIVAAELISFLLAELAQSATNITAEHVGSTAVLGLAAKPVLDIDLIFPVLGGDEIATKIIAKLSELGYICRGDLGITGRVAFGRLTTDTPKTKDGKIWPLHNLYLCRADSLSLRNHLLLRDYLRQNAEAVQSYTALKKNLAIQYPHDLLAYMRGKTAFIIDILARCGLSAQELAEIRAANT